MFTPNSFQATGSFAVPVSYHKNGGAETSFSLPYLVFNEAQNFIVHCFPAGFAEMNAHPIGGGADSFGEYSCLALRLLLFYRCRLHLTGPLSHDKIDLWLCSCWCNPLRVLSSFLAQKEQG
jgi:hypothetical protein